MATREAAIAAAKEAGYLGDDPLSPIAGLKMSLNELITYYSGLRRLEIARQNNHTLLSLLENERRQPLDAEQNDPVPVVGSNIPGVRTGSGTATHGRGHSSMLTRRTENAAFRRINK